MLRVPKLLRDRDIMAESATGSSFFRCKEQLDSCRTCFGQKALQVGWLAQEHNAERQTLGNRWGPQTAKVCHPFQYGAGGARIANIVQS